MIRSEMQYFGTDAIQIAGREGVRSGSRILIAKSMRMVYNKKKSIPQFGKGNACETGQTIRNGQKGETL